MLGDEPTSKAGRAPDDDVELAIGFAHFIGDEP
jgi:hypothetical protein